MVIIAVHDDILPCRSVTVNSTLFWPILLQSNVEVLMAVVISEQLSELPRSKSSGVMVAKPLASKAKVRLWHTAVG